MDISEYNKNRMYLYADGRWKESSDEDYLPEDKAKSLYDLMLAEGLIPRVEDDFILLSSGANTGSIERSLFDIDSSRRTGRSIVLAGDMLDIDTPFFYENPDNAGFYLHQIFNAADVPDCIPQELLPVDLILDNKASIWHAADFTLSARASGQIESQDYEYLENLLSKLFDTLEIGGGILIDHATPEYFFRERSTVAMIDLLDEHIWEELGLKYHDIGDGQDRYRYLYRPER